MRTLQKNSQSGINEWVHLDHLFGFFYECIHLAAVTIDPVFL